MKRDIRKLDDLDPSERLAAFLKMFPGSPDQPVRPGRSLFLDCLDEVLKADAADDGADDAGGLANHPVVQMARLLVASGKFGDHGQALDYLLNKPNGQALLSRMKAAETAKENTMPTTETPESILKDLGHISFCKAIVDRGRAPCTENELVAILSRYAAELFSMPGDRAYAKLHEAEILVRQAVAIAKNAPLVADLTPLMVGGAAARDVDDPAEAIANLKQLGARKWPTASAAEQFERALTAPENHKLARIAVPIPRATTSFPFPR